MKVTLRWLGSWILALACCQVFAQEELARSASDELALHDRMLELENRLAESEARLASIGDASAGRYTPARKTCCKDLWTHPCSGLFGDAELLLMAWTDTDGDDNQDNADTASRYTIGYMNPLGRSLRIRYFEFDIDDDAGAGELLLEYLDLVYAARFTLGHNWHGEISLGGRWAKMENPTPRVFEDTWGPLMGIDLRSELCDWVSLYGNARQSFQFGDELVEDHQHVFGITELAMGLELATNRRASNLFVRTGVESQHYSSIRDDEEDYGLIGWTLRVGIRR